VSASATVAMFFGCFRNRPSALVPWVLLGLSQVVYAAADTSFYVSHFIAGNAQFPALADVLYLAHYPLLVAGLVALIRLARRRAARGRRRNAVVAVSHRSAGACRLTHAGQDRFGRLSD